MASQPNATAQVMPQAAAEINGGVPQTATEVLDQSRGDPVGSSQSTEEMTVPKVDTTPDWQTLSEAMGKYDDRLLADWKDDLGNLLIFAGLFSSVVAVFTVDSYKSLQQDNAAISVQLLGQISSQLASFSMSAAFINSTVHPIPSQNLTAPSPPPELSVRINALWFLSLAISLTAALLAIIAQQWLREYRLPGHLPLREFIRLRQYRYDNLYDWGVPHIISILPFLLQLALVIFLTGLCELLHSLDRVVFIVSIVFVAIALSAYLGFTVLPLFFRQCPYKGPLVHGVGVVEIRLYLLTLNMEHQYYVCRAKLNLAFRRWFRDETARRDRGTNALIQSVYHLETKLATEATGPYNGEVQITRELRHLTRALWNHFDCRALIWAPSGVSTAELPHIERCFQDLDAENAFLCIFHWVSQTLRSNDNGTTPRGDTSQLGVSRYSLRYLTFGNIDTAFAKRFGKSLLEVLPSVSQAGQGLYQHDRCLLVLGILRDIVRLGAVDFVFTDAYTKKLLRMMALDNLESYDNDSTATYWDGLPGALFDVTALYHYDFNKEETMFCLDYACKIYRVFLAGVQDSLFVTNGVDCIMASSAVALNALCGYSDDHLGNPDLFVKAMGLLPVVRDTVVRGMQTIHDLGQCDPTVYGIGCLQVAVPASISICENIVRLGRAGALAFFEDDLVPFFDDFIATYSGQPAYQGGANVLRQFRDEIEPPQASGSGTSEQAVIGSQSSDQST